MEGMGVEVGETLLHYFQVSVEVQVLYLVYTDTLRGCFFLLWVEVEVPSHCVVSTDTVLRWPLYCCAVVEVLVLQRGHL